MLITTPISLGELLDKISILIIKDKKITDIEKKQHIVKELTSLYEALDKLISRDKVKEYIENLISINTKLWNIEDDIRNCERKKQFDQIFIKLARSVYFTNDKRANIKLNINEKFGSELIEVKSYEKYS